MQDYIKELCNKYNIQLVYTKNKYTMLSTGLSKGMPVLRVHTLFKGCPSSIAEAIEDLFILNNDPESALSVLEEYIRLNDGPDGYKIIPPANEFQSNLEVSQRELKVSQIIQKNLLGESIHIKPTESILIEDSEILELDITVDGIDL